jgi:hypothetical protein
MIGTDNLIVDDDQSASEAAKPRRDRKRVGLVFLGLIGDINLAREPIDDIVAYLNSLGEP